MANCPSKGEVSNQVYSANITLRRGEYGVGTLLRVLDRVNTFTPSSDWALTSEQSWEASLPVVEGTLILRGQSNTYRSNGTALHVHTNSQCRVGYSLGAHKPLAHRLFMQPTDITLQLTSNTDVHDLLEGLLGMTPPLAQDKLIVSQDNDPIPSESVDGNRYLRILAKIAASLPW